MMACLPAPSAAATPSSASISPITSTVPLVVRYQSLQEDYQSRLSELKELKDKLESVTHSAGRGFPDQTSLKEDDKLTSQYTGLPNYDVLMAVFRMVEKCIPESNQRAKLSKFHCFMLVLMKLRMNPSNYDLAFRFCVHDTNYGCSTFLFDTVAKYGQSTQDYAMVLSGELWHEGNIYH